MAKYLLLADGHFSFKLCPIEIEFVQRAAAKILGKNSWPMRKITGYYERRWLNYLQLALNQANQSGPYEGLISLGDNFFDWDNLGLDTAEKISEAKESKQRLLKHFVLPDEQQIWVPGNHDLGYQNSSWTCGPILPPAANFSCYQNIYGPTYGLKQLNEYYWMAWVSTVHIETIITQPSKLAASQLNWLIQKQQEELAFLDEELEKINGKFFFGVHDPGSFLSPQLATILNRHLGKLAGSFTGHFHAEWLLKLAKIRQPSWKKIFNRYQVQFIPSIWGIILPLLFKTTGAGWAELNLQGDQMELIRRTVINKL